MNRGAPLTTALIAASLALTTPPAHAAEALTSVPGMTATYEGTANGIATFTMTAADDGPGAQTLRVLLPTDPARGVPHEFLFVLPVEAGLGTQYGDGLKTVQALGAQNTYNLTVIEPTFAVDPWYANSTTQPAEQYEAFMTELVAWARANLSTDGREQTWLLGFSKSGLGAQDLILKHPNLFDIAASWDFPASMASTDAYGSSEEAEYGSQANYAQNYELTPSFVAAHAAPFVAADRIWIGGYHLFESDVSSYGAELSAAGVQYDAETPADMAHAWGSGWVPLALAALSQMSAALRESGRDR
jgi:Putative esterase